jgi:hypothetical protein
MDTIVLYVGQVPCVAIPGQVTIETYQHIYFHLLGSSSFEGKFKTVIGAITY